MNDPQRQVARSVGELRPSQLLHTYGVGSVIDLPHLSVMVMGLEDWDRNRARILQEDRLLARVRETLGSQVLDLRAPPLPDEQAHERAWMGGDADPVGVPVAPFPRWLRCPRCDLLAPIRSGLFKLKLVPSRPDRAAYVHENCNRGRAPTALPARFLLACERGHLDDFPWTWFVHRGADGCRGILRLSEFGVSGEAADVHVVCDECKARRAMIDAFGRRKDLPSCRARHPHLREFEEDACDDPNVVTMLLGASNSWFSVTHSVVYIPSSAEAKIDRRVDEQWDRLAAVPNAGTIVYLRSQQQLGSLQEFDDEAIWSAIQRRKESGAANVEDVRDLKGPEWEVLSDPASAPTRPDFQIVQVAPPERWKEWIEDVLLVERLREVTALVGFTRIRSAQDFDEAEGAVRVPLSRTPPLFAPATEVRGEGIFLRFDESRLSAWCAGHAEDERRFFEAHQGWRRRRRLEPVESDFPGIRFGAIHTFAHALMRELSAEAGYAAASLRERIYSRDPGDGEPMAGVLIYTAAPDSEGTLGGLVRMGHPEALDRHIGRALAALDLCSADPLCAEHDPEPDGATLHGAACHACLFAPETSCESGNRYLDRGMLVPTVRNRSNPLFAKGGSP